MKLESEIQNAIMRRYFYYQLINVYVTVGFSGNNLWIQIIKTLQKPQTLVDVIGGRMPNVSLFFANLMIVKVNLSSCLNYLWRTQDKYPLSLNLFQRRNVLARFMTLKYHIWSTK